MTITAIAELTTESNTPPTDPVNLRITTQHKSGTALIWCDIMYDNCLCQMRAAHREVTSEAQQACNLIPKIWKGRYARKLSLTYLEVVPEKQDCCTKRKGY